MGVGGPLTPCTRRYGLSAQNALFPGPFICHKRFRRSAKGRAPQRPGPIHPLVAPHLPPSAPPLSNITPHRATGLPLLYAAKHLQGLSHLISPSSLWPLSLKGSQGSRGGIKRPGTRGEGSHKEREGDRTRCRSFVSHPFCRVRFRFLSRAKPLVCRLAAWLLRFSAPHFSSGAMPKG